jgi:hypothetical protein
MTYLQLTRSLVFATALFSSSAAVSRAEEAPATKDGLTEFSSPEGGFSVRLLGKPAYSKTTVGVAKELHHMFTDGTPQGVYLISYQENPNLEGASPQGLSTALETGRDGLINGLKGKLVECKETKLDKKHPGLSFRMTIPAAQGEARCRHYLVGTRLYQVMALGTPEFAGSDQATRVLDSFKLLPPATPGK